MVLSVGGTGSGGERPVSYVCSYGKEAHSTIALLLQKNSPFFFLTRFFQSWGSVLLAR